MKELTNIYLLKFNELYKAAQPSTREFKRAFGHIEQFVDAIKRTETSELDQNSIIKTWLLQTNALKCPEMIPAIIRPSAPTEDKEGIPVCNVDVNCLALAKCLQKFIDEAQQCITEEDGLTSVMVNHYLCALQMTDFMLIKRIAKAEFNLLNHHDRAIGSAVLEKCTDLRVKLALMTGRRGRREEKAATIPANELSDFAAQAVEQVAIARKLSTGFILFGPEDTETETHPQKITFDAIGARLITAFCSLVNESKRMLTTEQRELSCAAHPVSLRQFEEGVSAYGVHTAQVHQDRSDKQETQQTWQHKVILLCDTFIADSLSYRELHHQFLKPSSPATQRSARALIHLEHAIKMHRTCLATELTELTPCSYICFENIAKKIHAQLHAAMRQEDNPRSTLSTFLSRYETEFSTMYHSEKATKNKALASCH